jgi:hypothetical protein
MQCSMPHLLAGNSRILALIGGLMEFVSLTLTICRHISVSV